MLLFGFLFFIVSCEKEPLAHDDLIHVSLTNQISEAGTHHYYLSFKTDKIYPCINYGLDIATSFENGRIEVNIIDIIEPQSVCLTALGPAQGSIELQLPDNGQYPLHIRAFGKLSTGTITKDKEAYRLNFANTSNIVIARATLRKIPPHTIWGIVGYASTLLEPVVESFFNDLEALGATHQGLPSGEYGPFDVDNDGKYVLSELHGYYHATTLLYRYEGDNDALIDIVTQYGNEYEGLTINIYDTHGNSYHSWDH